MIKLIKNLIYTNLLIFNDNHFKRYDSRRSVVVTITENNCRIFLVFDTVQIVKANIFQRRGFSDYNRPIVSSQPCPI